MAACEPQPRGRSPDDARRVASLQRECERWQRECARQQALVRAAQRSIGLAPPLAPAAKDKGKKQRRRRPVVRALAAAQRLREEPAAVAVVSTTHRWGKLDYRLTDKTVGQGESISLLNLVSSSGSTRESRNERSAFGRQEDAMRGRKPRGPEIVRELKGGEQERQRLEAILDTVAGRLGVTEAADQLGMTPQRLHMLREQMRCRRRWTPGAAAVGPAPQVGAVGPGADRCLAA